MNNAQNVEVDTGHDDRAPSNCAEALPALGNFSVPMHELSLTKTGCRDGRSL
jgi:hypothetical protein